MKIKELLNTRKRWTQGTYAKTARGMRVPPTSLFAVKWCLLGAAQHCYPDQAERSKALEAIRELLPEDCRGQVDQFNDSTTFPKVKALLKKANV